MQTIAIDIEKTKKPKEIADILEKESVQRGDKILVLSEKEQITFFLVSFLVIIWFALHYVAKRRTNIVPVQNTDESEMPGISAEKIINEFETPEIAEKAIESKFGVSVEFATKPEKLYDPIEAAFGMWHDHDVTIEKIRTEAWERKK